MAAAITSIWLLHLRQTLQQSEAASWHAVRGHLVLPCILCHSVGAETPNQRESCAACSPQLPQLQQHRERRVVVSRHRRQQQQRSEERMPGLLQEDEEVQRISLDRLASANPVFAPEGLTTSENAFRLGDGAAAVVLAADEEATKRGLKPLARQAWEKHSPL